MGTDHSQGVESVAKWLWKQWWDYLALGSPTSCVSSKVAKIAVLISYLAHCQLKERPCVVMTNESKQRLPLEGYHDSVVESDIKQKVKYSCHNAHYSANEASLYKACKTLIGIAESFLTRLACMSLQDHGIAESSSSVVFKTELKQSALSLQV